MASIRTFAIQLAHSIRASVERGEMTQRNIFGGDPHSRRSRDYHPTPPQGPHPDEGKRIRLVRCTDPYTKLQPGLEGTILFVDAMQTRHVQWDNGSSLGLVPGEDQWEVI